MSLRTVALAQGMKENASTIRQTTICALLRSCYLFWGGTNHCHAGEYTIFVIGKQPSRSGAIDFGPRETPTETANERCGMCRAVVKAKLSDHTITQSGNDQFHRLAAPSLPKKIDPRGSAHGGRSMNGKSKVCKKETTFPPPLSCRHSCFPFTGSVTKGLSSARYIDRAHTCSHL